jgi:protein-tyrosine phosphatase
VHGDLNGANILLDEPGNVWLIDFFHAHRGHVLRDLIKLENDLLYIWTKIGSDDELIEAMKLTDWLLSVRDLGREPTPESMPTFQSQALARAAQTILKLRSFYPGLIQADRETTQLLIPQIRYAVHTLSFEESNPWQKRWALYIACRAAELLKRLAQHAGPLRVDWMPERFTSPGRLGLTIVPGRRDYERSLDADIRSLQRDGIQAVLCLLAHDEFERYGVVGLLDRYRDAGMAVLHLPTIDRTPPSDSAIHEAMAWIESQLEDGHRVLVHCVGGLGRAGTIAACWLRQKGLDGDTAIKLVRDFRSPRAIETIQQEESVRSFQFDLSDTTARAKEALKILAACLRTLADASTDLSAANGAMAFARRINMTELQEAEMVIGALRSDLGSKSDLTDGVGQPDAYWLAFHEVELASKVAGNWLVALRRPDLAFVAQSGDEA